MQVRDEPTPEELELFDEISSLGSDLWDKTTELEGWFNPKLMSSMIYKRLWSNHKAYIILWHNRQFQEADTILRSALEASICIAANFRLKDRFVALVKEDAAFTIQQQVKLHRLNGEEELAKDGERTLAEIGFAIPANKKPKALVWKDLAEEGRVPQLYGFYRMLSGLSSHITGLSILRSITNDQWERRQDELDRSHKMHLMMMAGATLNGGMLHAAMIEEPTLVERASLLTDRMNIISMRWAS